MLKHILLSIAFTAATIPALAGSPAPAPGAAGGIDPKNPAEDPMDSVLPSSEKVVLGTDAPKDPALELADRYISQFSQTQGIGVEDPITSQFRPETRTKCAH
jgi:hypothetical protein